MVQILIFLVAAGAAFGIAGYRLWILYRLMKAHQGKRVPLQPLGQIPQRFGATLLNVLGQKAVLQKKWIGALHATIFWGFIVVSVGTLEQFVSTLVPGASFEFLGEGLYSAFLFVHDLFTFLVLLAVVGAAWRRVVVRPTHLGQSSDANWILVFTAGLMVSIFGMHGFLIAGESPWFASSMPFSSTVATLASGLGLEGETATHIGLGFKWIHMLLVLGFAAYIPGSKHLHVLAAGPNTFFMNLKREKAMAPMDLEDETAEQFGAAKTTDLSWKDALDYYACTECGRCQEVCPAWNTEKPLSPKNLITRLKENMVSNRDAILAGKTDEITPLIDAKMTEDVIWACTSCRACEVACPVFIEHTDKIYDIRRNLVLMESKFPTEVQNVFRNLETNASPWAFAAADRAEWTKEHSIPTIAEEPNPEILFWVGCAGSYDDRNKKVAQALARILKKAGLRFAILGTEEQCTGDPARRIGNEYLFQTLAQANVETLNRHGIKKIVTACPHCFNTLKNEYPEFGGTYDVVHHTQLVAQLITEGKIKPARSLEETITFHDSCYMGRWNGVYSEPRDILEAIPSARTVEMKSNHEKSMCCGAGGGRMWMEETIGKKINVTRTEQAIETNAGIVASSCPFCMTMIADGVKTKNMQDKIVVKDLAELVDEALT